MTVPGSSVFLKKVRLKQLHLIQFSNAKYPGNKIIITVNEMYGGTT